MPLDPAAREEPLRIALGEGAELAALLSVPASTAGPEEPRPAGVVIPDPRAADQEGARAEARALARELARVGLLVLLPELDSPPAEAAAAGGELPDRTALTRLDAVLAHLAADPRVDPERIAVLGLGRGGTLAFLFACHARGVAAVVVLGGALVYPSLGPSRPLQPLEMALNLGAPALLVLAADDPATPEPDRERARAVLSQFARTFDIVTLPGARVSVGTQVLAGVSGFLREHLDLADT